MTDERPFQLLTHAEFSTLSTEEKIAYMARAMENLASSRGPLFAESPPGQPRLKDP